MMNLLEDKIITKKDMLEYLITISPSLQNKEVIRCSVELDKLITKYHERIGDKGKIRA
jgi:hypothetical protein